MRGTWFSGGTVAGPASTASTISAIVRTVLIGYRPTLVSPDSMTASVPSSTAFATSEVSARVGRELEIIESSIWVATMTGLAFSRAIWMARFCTSGTFCRGSSTPRSPRATMIPSKARTMASRLSTASGFSSLAITGTRPRPVLSMILWTRSMSAGLRTKESATTSTRSDSANSRSETSFSESAGTVMFMPGRLRPLLSETGPPSVTRQTTSLPSMATTRRPTLPSSTSSRSSTLASCARPL